MGLLVQAAGVFLGIGTFVLGLFLFYDPNLTGVLLSFATGVAVCMPCMGLGKLLDRQEIIEKYLELILKQVQLPVEYLTCTHCKKEYEKGRENCPFCGQK